MPIEAWLLIAVLAVAVSFGAGVLVGRSRGAGSLREGVGAAANRLPAEEAGPDRTELLRVADRLGVGVVRTDARGLIVVANEAAHRYVGRTEGSLVGRSIMEAFVDHRIEDLTNTARSDGSAQRELVFAGEPPRTVTVRAQRADSGGVWIALEDTSELRRLQRIRTEFIDNLSHELRTPLTTVRLLTETLVLELERTEEVPARVRDSILKIDVETGHLVQMVDELLDLSRIEQGEAPLSMQELDLGRLIENGLDRLRTYGERQGVNLRGEMPANREERLILGDEERLGQLLINLIQNAVKFSPDGGEVVVRLRATPTELLIEVQDSGVGIARGDLDRIFERFYKGDRARVRGTGGGTGLGLAIARHIAERHGGRIWAESEEGSGSLFTVALPRVRGEP